MAQADTGVGSAPATESSDGNYLAALQADADASFAALEDPTPISAEATADAPAEDAISETVVSDEAVAAPESVVDAELAGNDDEVITRRNARELVEKARAEKEEAIKAAAKAEEDRRALEASQAQQQARLNELAGSWGQAGEHAKRLESAIAREDWNTIDQVAEQFGLSNPSAADARALLTQLDEQHARNGDLRLSLHESFIGQFGPAYKAAAERAGVDWEALRTEQNPSITLTRLLDGERDKVKSELDGRIKALETENKALRAKVGASGASPEAGGNGASGALPKTVQELERMSLQEFDKSFDRILETIPR